MTSAPIRFEHGPSYEDYMGRWSELVGRRFIEWLAPAPALRWLDVGCGSGAFTELIASHCAPRSIAGIDPSAGMLSFARARDALRAADLRQGDAMALPFADDAFDVAVMPLVIFFVPEPARAVTEMARVVAPGGTVAAYSWDMDNDGFPYALLQRTLEDMRIGVAKPPSPDASRHEVAMPLWAAAGLHGIRTGTLTVERSFASIDSYWQTLMGGPRVGETLAALEPDVAAQVRQRLQSALPHDATGCITYPARANVISGVV